MATDALNAACPAHGDRDDRKSAAIAAANVRPKDGARVVGSYAGARAVLRSALMKQAGAQAEDIKFDNPEHVSFFFLDGDLHRKRRAAVASYFTPKTIIARYHSVMQRTMDALIAELRAAGSAPLDVMSFQMAVDVAADIVGLVESDRKGLARRVRAVLNASFVPPARTRIGRSLQMARTAWAAWDFHQKDVAPAVKARRAQPRDDVISYMVKEGYSRQSMIIECLTYGSAGMMTTREFIVMAAWHLFGNDALRERYLAGPEPEQFAILEEIVRLEPVAAMLHRRADADTEDAATGQVREGQLLAIDIRQANTDEAITGPCPHALDPDRARRMKVMGSYMSFGDGAHRCPGSQVALHETRIFLDRLLRVPGVRLAQEPTVQWLEALGSYELRGAIVACDRA